MESDMFCHLWHETSKKSFCCCCCCCWWMTNCCVVGNLLWGQKILYRCMRVFWLCIWIFVDCCEDVMIWRYANRNQNKRTNKKETKTNTNKNTVKEITEEQKAVLFLVLISRRNCSRKRGRKKNGAYQSFGTSKRKISRQNLKIDIGKKKNAG